MKQNDIAEAIAFYNRKPEIFGTSHYTSLRL